MQNQSKISSISQVMTAEGIGDSFMEQPAISCLNYWEAGKLPIDGCSESVFKNAENRVLAQEDLVSIKRQLDEENCTVSQPHSMRTVAIPGSSSNADDRAWQKRRRTNQLRELRRARIHKGLKALEELFPNSTKGGTESQLDDVIGYIKFLKLQLKVLSNSRLGGEATSNPFIHLEGYGHYLFHDELVGEPLEELAAELMEKDLPAAVQLLDSKGLSLIPMALASDILHCN